MAADTLRLKDDYELRYLRAVMEWLEQGGMYEPLDIEAIYRDWNEHIRHGKPSQYEPPPLCDFRPPPH